jgi:hypothetical protein
MKAIVLSLVIASSASFPLLATAYNHGDLKQQVSISASALAADIDMAEWSLRHSSVSKAIPSSVLDVSLTALTRAREELAAGNLRTAQDILQRASQPLSRMTYSAMEGRHPDEQARILETRQTLESIIDAAERIATEKNAPNDFIARARDSVRQSDALLAAGEQQAAEQILDQAYGNVSRRIAELRSGESFYIPAPAGATHAEWRDGLRRIEERREITRYILLEAKADGLDVAPLEQGAKTAEALVGSAAAYAGERRWDLALATLDRAYAEYEESWRAVGVDW